MSSIMDELKTLQGKRRPQSVDSPAEPGLGDGAVDAPQSPRAGARPAGRRRLVGGLLVVLVVLVVVLVALPHGGRTRNGTQQAAGGQIAAATRETPEQSGPAESTVAAVDAAAAPTEDEAEPDIVIGLVPPYTEPTFGRLDPPEPEAAETAETGEPIDATADAEPAEATTSLSLLMPYAEPTFGGLDAPAADAAPAITPEQDEANKAAIRALEVRAVLGDEHGIGLYTSEGNLHEGSSFHGMQVRTITTRYVVFECGPKRYKWPLPR